MAALIILSIILAFILIINIYMRISTYKQIVTNKDPLLKDIDCILVLGAGIIENSRPTLTLRDRLNKSIASGDDYSITYKLSVELDELIAQFYRGKLKEKSICK